MTNENPTPDGDSDEAPPLLSNLSRDELRSRARAMGVRNVSSMAKDDLVIAILNAEAEASRSDAAAAPETPEGDTDPVEYDPAALERLATKLAGENAAQRTALVDMIAAAQPFAEAFTQQEAHRGPALTMGQTLPFSMGQLKELRDAHRGAAEVLELKGA